MIFLEDKKFITVKDFSVSGESFSLLYNEAYDLLKTHPQPSLESLPSYYESEDYISHTDGKRTLFEKTYHLVKSNAIKNKIKLINQWHPKKGTLLDIGAGTGDFLSEAKKQNWIITGIEPNEKAKQIAIQKGVSFETNLEELADESFDVISMWHVLEHVPNLEEHIAILKRLLKPNGTIIIAVPNFKSYDSKYYAVFWAAYDAPRHLWHFSKTAIKKLFADQNMQLKKVKPMWFDSFYVALLSEKYKTRKMNFIKGISIGFLSNMIGLLKNEFSSHIYIIKKQ